MDSLSIDIPHNKVLTVLYDTNGTISDEEAITKLKDVFEELEANRFDGYIDHFRSIIRGLPEKEKDLFEMALKEFGSS